MRRRVETPAGALWNKGAIIPPPAPPNPSRLAGNVVPLPAPHPLVARHGTTPLEMRALVRELALWMHDRGVEDVHLSRAPGTAQIMLTVDGAPL